MAEKGLDNANRYNCPRCRARSRARVSTALVAAPEVLAVQLKRFVALNDLGDTEKDGALVDFPLDGLDLRPWMDGGGGAAGSGGVAGAEGDAPPPVYDLFAVCQHRGPGLNAGHYTCLSRAPPTKAQPSPAWTLRDDERVVEAVAAGAPRAVAERSVVTAAAFLLFYRRRD